jgi:hypothetical protein
MVISMTLSPTKRRRAPKPTMTSPYEMPAIIRNDLREGSPHPLGATWTDLGVNFALFSATATKVELCLFDDQTLHGGSQETDATAGVHRGLGASCGRKHVR